MQKRDYLKKTKQFGAMHVYWRPMGFSKIPIIRSLKFEMAEIRQLENRRDIIFFCRGWSDLDKISQTGAEWHVDCGDIDEFETRSRMADVRANSMARNPRATCHIAGCCHLANSMSWSQSYVSHCRVLPPGEFNDMLSQSHVSRCRVGLLPLGEFTVIILEPHATLRDGVTWQNQCHDRATLRVKEFNDFNPPYWKSFFAIFYFLFS